MSAQARERVMANMQKKKTTTVKREIPELLADEFRMLLKEAAELREKKGVQTCVGCGGAEVYTRQRKDSTESWMTIKRL